MKLRRGEVPSYQTMVALLDAAEAGDEKALQDARQISSQLAKRANVRLKALEEADYEASPAYMRVRDTIGRDRWRVRFSESKKLSTQELETQLEELNIFLGREESTVSGEKLRRSGIDTMIADGTISVKDENKKRALLRFLQSDEWNAYKALAGYQKGSMQTIVNAIENGKTLKDFTDLYEKSKLQIARGKNINLLDEWERM